jgi:hypothetical protein
LFHDHANAPTITSHHQAQLAFHSFFQKGIASLTAPLKSTGNPSILKKRKYTDQPIIPPMMVESRRTCKVDTYFLPAPVIPHPHNNAAGQQKILHGTIRREIGEKGGGKGCVRTAETTPTAKPFLQNICISSQLLKRGDSFCRNH